MAGAIAKYHCNYCEEDITSIRVKCSECQDFDLCLECFSCGAEIGSHKSKHAYQLIDCGTFPIFSNGNSSDNWKAYEEIALLDGIDQYGLGNWSDIVLKIGKDDAQEAKDHYINYYVTGNIGKTTWSMVDNKAFYMKDHTCPNDGPLSPSLTTPLPAITEVGQQEQQTLGYMPKRDDFEREIDNEAESLVSTLTINANDDDELEGALKLAHISMYQRRLKERFRKKHIAREYGLVNLFFKSQNASNEQSHDSIQKNAISKDSGKKKINSSFREELVSQYDEKYKPFCQFETWEEHQEFFQNLRRERELKSRIKELMRYRRNGLKKLSECTGFESSRSKREKRKENKKKSISNIGSEHKRLFGTATRGSSGEKDNNNVSGASRKGDQKESNSPKSELKGFDINSLPGCRLLSEREKKLCASIKLRPTQYVTLKTLILKDHAQKRKGLQSKSSLENIDKSIRRKVVNFMIKNGWLTSTS